MTKASQQRTAAEAAAKLVEDGMVVGLGTGSTASKFIEALIHRVKTEGLNIRAIPTSNRSGKQAEEGGIRMTSFAQIKRVDLTVDGADQILPGPLHLVKGLGGALLREKIVAAASNRLVIIAEAAKRVDRLGGLIPIPVEVVKFGWESTARHIEDLGGKPVQRWPKDADEPFQTELGNYILDCSFPPLDAPALLDAELSRTIGVVESGLFIFMAHTAIIGTNKGIEILERTTG